MTWQEKMKSVVEGVLGEGYKLVIIDEFNYTVSFNGNLLVGTQTLHKLSSHWPKCAKDAIDRIINILTEEQINLIKWKHA